MLNMMKIRLFTYVHDSRPHSAPFCSSLGFRVYVLELRVWAALTAMNLQAVVATFETPKP